MAVGHPSTFPVETITADQRQALRQYITERQESEMGLREPVWLALVINGEKPACYANQGLGSSPLITDGWTDELAGQAVPPEMEIDVVPLEETTPDITVADVLDAFGLSYRGLGGAGWYVARTAWRLELLPTVRNGATAAYHRRLGAFFGYARADINYFITSEPPRPQPAALVAEGHYTPEEIAYTTFVPEIFEPEPERVARATRTGRTIRDRMAQLARQWELPALEDLAATVYEEAVSDCRDD